MPNQPIIVIPHATTFLLAGCFAINTAIKNETLGLMNVTTGLIGIVLVLAAFALLIALIPNDRLRDYASRIEQLSPWLYAILIGFTIAEVFNLLIIYLNYFWLWIIPGIFILLIIIVILTTSRQIFQNLRLLTLLCAVLNGMGIVQFISKDEVGSLEIFVLGTLLLVIAATLKQQQNPTLPRAN